MKLIPCAFAALLGLSSLLAAAQARDVVTIGYPQAIGLANADMGFGIKLGLFAEENIDLKLVALDGTARIVPQIASGGITAGFVHPDYILSALDKGQAPPVKYVYNWRRRSPYELVVMANSPVKSVAELKGKKVGIGALTWANIPMVRAVTQEAGIKWQQELTMVPVGVGPAGWRQLGSGAVDAMAYPQSENEKMSASGMAIRRLDLPEKYRNMFTNGLLVSDQLIKSNPDLVRRLGRAIAKTTAACHANAEECLKGAWVVDPTLKPAADKEAEWIKTYLPLQQANYKDMLNFSGAQPLLGSYPENGWQTHIAVMQASGTLTRPSLPLEQIVTTQFIQDFNKFDRAAVEAKARAAK
jgi:NitT/TauT family transport system substrate-binding protein